MLDKSGFLVFSRHLVFSIFVSFLLPFWSLCFATEALGGEREARNLIWVLSRPLPRWSIYLAKFAALLPWGLALNLGGFFLVCLAAGKPGLLAFRLYWPAVGWATLAFCALFHLMAAVFRRAALVAIFYTFFLEIIVGNMPGYLNASASASNTLPDVRRLPKHRRLSAGKSVHSCAGGRADGVCGIIGSDGGAAGDWHGGLRTDRIPRRNLSRLRLSRRCVNVFFGTERGIGSGCGNPATRDARRGQAPAPRCRLR